MAATARTPFRPRPLRRASCARTLNLTQINDQVGTSCMIPWIRAEGFIMRQTGRGRNRQHSRLARRRPRSWSVLLLMAAFAVSVAGLFSSIPGGSHAAQAAMHQHMTVAVADGSVDGACCADHDTRIHGTECGMTSGCAFCVPASTSAASATTGANGPEIWPDATQIGRTPSPSPRPPEFLANA